ncbi:MAG TPA: hypothetical protein VIQ30_20045 [Pseudonocardia sp.]
MIEQEDGRVAGSIDRARVAELHAATDDEEMKAYYREILGDTEEGRAIDEPAEDESETEDAPPPVDVDLDELRGQAEALGVKVDGRWGAERLREEIAAYDDKKGEG